MIGAGTSRDIVQLGDSLHQGMVLRRNLHLPVPFARGENISLSSVNKTSVLQLLNHGRTSRSE